MVRFDGIDQVQQSQMLRMGVCRLDRSRRRTRAWGTSLPPPVPRLDCLQVPPASSAPGRLHWLMEPASTNQLLMRASELREPDNSQIGTSFARSYWQHPQPSLSTSWEKEPSMSHQFTRFGEPLKDEQNYSRIRPNRPLDAPGPPKKPHGSRAIKRFFQRPSIHGLGSAGKKRHSSTAAVRTNSTRYPGAASWVCKQAREGAWPFGTHASHSSLKTARSSGFGM